jgi:hypothetical protein
LAYAKETRVIFSLVTRRGASTLPGLPVCLFVFTFIFTMTTFATIPCLSKSGQVGHSVYFGRNQYGPWESSNVWTKEQWEGLDGPRVDAIIALAALWHTMSQSDKNSWTRYANRLRLPLYTSFIKFNMPRIANDLEPLTVFT